MLWNFKKEQAARLNTVLCPQKFRLVLEDETANRFVELPKSLAEQIKKARQQAVKDNVFFKSSLSLNEPNSKDVQQIKDLQSQQQRDSTAVSSTYHQPVKTR